MKVSELGLTASAESKLSRLAMAVEVHCRHRFSIRKDVMDVAALLIIAETSENAEVLQRFRELMDSLSPAVRTLLLEMTGGELSRSPVRSRTADVAGFVGRMVAGSPYPAAQPGRPVLV